jgi:glycerophosphoryl diester phosphodiesterase
MTDENHTLKNYLENSSKNIIKFFLEYQTNLEKEHVKYNIELKNINEKIEQYTNNTKIIYSSMNYWKMHEIIYNNSIESIKNNMLNLSSVNSLLYIQLNNNLIKLNELKNTSLVNYNKYFLQLNEIHNLITNLNVRKNEVNKLIHCVECNLQINNTLLNNLKNVIDNIQKNTM